MTPAEICAELESIRDLVRRNVPLNRYPERFHEVKSDISRRLTLLRDAVARPAQSGRAR